MLRLYFLQQLFNLLDPVWKKHYSSTVDVPFFGIDLGWEPVLDKSTNFGLHHLLEAGKSRCA